LFLVVVSCLCVFFFFFFLPLLPPPPPPQEDRDPNHPMGQTVAGSAHGTGGAYPGVSGENIDCSEQIAVAHPLVRR
ncbi:MAG: hypothetical protein ACK4YP_26755, partial [Myxococcota bacterium]